LTQLRQRVAQEDVVGGFDVLDQIGQVGGLPIGVRVRGRLDRIGDVGQDGIDVKRTFFADLRKRAFTTATIIDVKGRQDLCRLRVVGNDGSDRFTGMYGHKYNSFVSGGWVHRIKRWACCL
jgi:hypothetical protein